MKQIIIHAFAFLTILAFASNTLIINTQAQSNTFGCSFNPGTLECYADLNLDNCQPGYARDAGFCPQFNNNESGCITATAACVLTQSSLYRCAGVGNCIPCNSGDWGCTYQNINACQTACSSASSPHRCTNNGCVPDNTCTSAANGCFLSQQACESSNCRPHTPTPLPPCPSITDPAICNNAPNCVWRNNACIIGANSITPTPTEELKFLYNLCLNIPSNDPARAKCESCVGGNPPVGVYTAVGCLPTSTLGLTTSLLRIAIGLGGGFALLLIVYGAFQLSMAAGDPKGTQAGKETITSALVGLIIVIFSVVILNLIGVTILEIPGF